LEGSVKARVTVQNTLATPSG